MLVCPIVCVSRVSRIPSSPLQVSPPHASSASGCASVYFTFSPVEYSSEISLFRISRSRCKAAVMWLGTTVLFRILYNKIENVIFVFCFCLCFICCVKTIVNRLSRQYYIANCMIWEHSIAPTLLRSWTLNSKCTEFEHTTVEVFYCIK